MIAKHYRHLPKNSRSFRPQAPTQDLCVLEVKENSAHQLPWLHYIMLKMHQPGACKEVQMRRRNRTAFLPAGFLCQTCPHPPPSLRQPVGGTLGSKGTKHAWNKELDVRFLSTKQLTSVLGPQGGILSQVRIYQMSLSLTLFCPCDNFLSRCWNGSPRGLVNNTIIWPHLFLLLKPGVLRSFLRRVLTLCCSTRIPLLIELEFGNISRCTECLLHTFGVLRFFPCLGEQGMR